MGCAASSETAPPIPVNKHNPNYNNSGLRDPTETTVKVEREKQSAPLNHTQPGADRSTGLTEIQAVQSNNARNGREQETKKDEDKMSTVKAQEVVPDASVTNGNKAGDTASGERDNTVSTVAVTSKGNKSDGTKSDKGSKSGDGKGADEDCLIEEYPEDQRKFDSVLRLACGILKSEALLKRITQNVTKLQLQRALPQHIELTVLLKSMTNLKVLDISNNSIGPQAFRAVCLAMCYNSRVVSLNMAGSQTDTDSAECLGRMLTKNTVLQYLDVSSNYLGKDFFSRNVGPALKVNTALKTLRCESVGSTDVKALMEGLKDNRTLTELDFSSNDVTDRAALGKGLAECLKRSDCSLYTLSLSRCGMNMTGTQALQTALASNTSLRELNLAGNEFGSLNSLLEFVVGGAMHPCLENLNLESSTVKDKTVSDVSLSCDKISSLRVLSLNNCGLSDAFFKQFWKCCQGKLLSLTDISLSANDGLTTTCIENVVKLASDETQPCSIRRLTYGLNSAEELPGLISGNQLPCLQYLNLRMSRISHASVGSLGSVLGQGSESSLSSLILDNLKLSGTSALSHLLGTAKAGPLSALSLSGCVLDDNDLSPLTDCLKNGWQIHMLKLSANRITDVGVANLVEALLKNKKHPLAVLDLSSNRVEDDGAKSLSKIYTTKSHSSSLHSVNLCRNSIGKEGLLSLMSILGGKSALYTLYLQDQSNGQDECHIIEIYTRLAAALGLQIVSEGDHIKVGCSAVPDYVPDRLTVNMTGLGGQTGEIGQMLDSSSIQTDYPRDRLPSLTLSNIMEICSYLKGLDSSVCVWSDVEWSMITGANKATTDTPSWLKVSNQRDRTVYLSNLPGNTTQQKIEAVLEMEADCNLDEACLMKDPVTRSISGVGWAVLSDTQSLQKAVDYFNTGEAKIFGQAFIVSALNVTVDDEASTEAERKAREDQALRQKQRKSEEESHRSLINTATEESWKRHAYRLAHPAYADGRIW